MMDDQQEIRKLEADRWWELQKDALLYSKEYGVIVVRSLILINGGAIIAFLSFLSSSKFSDGLNSNATFALKGCIVSFVVGLILSIAVGGIGYINFQYLTAKLPDPSDLSRYISDGDVSGFGTGRWDTYTAWIAVFVTLLATAAFIVGTYFALCAIIVR
jgi:hypothetical protein